MTKEKDFKAPTSTPVKVWSPDFLHSALIGDTWTPIREDLWSAAYGGGCISRDMIANGYSQEQAVATMKREEITFEENVREVMKEIMEIGDPDMVDAAGRPKVQAIGERTLKIPSSQLRNKLFNELKGK